MRVGDGDRVTDDLEASDVVDVVPEIDHRTGVEAVGRDPLTESRRLVVDAVQALDLQLGRPPCDDRIRLG